MVKLADIFVLRKACCFSERPVGNFFRRTEPPLAAISAEFGLGAEKLSGR